MKLFSRVITTPAGRTDCRVSWLPLRRPPSAWASPGTWCRTSTTSAPTSVSATSCGSRRTSTWWRKLFVKVRGRKLNTLAGVTSENTYNINIPICQESNFSLIKAQNRNWVKTLKGLLIIESLGFRGWLWVHFRFLHPPWPGLWPPHSPLLAERPRELHQEGPGQHWTWATQWTLLSILTRPSSNRVFWSLFLNTKYENNPVRSHHLLG